MKSMLNLMVLLLFVVSAVSLSAQTNPLPGSVTFLKQSPKITKAKGRVWAKNETWVECDNMICWREVKDTSETTNFYWLQSANYNFNGKKYYVFYYTCLWETQSDTGGRKIFPSTKYMIINDSAYAVLKRVILEGNDTPTQIKSTKSESSMDGVFVSKNFAYYVGSDMKHDWKSYDPACFWVNSLKKEGKDIVQFQLPGHCSGQLLEQWHFYVSKDEFKKLLID